MENLVNYLSSIYPLSSALLDFLTSVIRIRKIKKKDCLPMPSRTNRHFCYVQEGLLRSFYTDNYGLDISTWFFRENDFIYSIETHESIQALENCNLYYIGIEDLEYARQNYREFNYILNEMADKCYRLSVQQLFFIRMRTAKERYEWLLNNQPELLLRAPSKHLASYLGITESTLSKVKSKFYTHHTQS